MTNALITGILNIPGLLYADDPAIASFKNHVLQRTFDVVDNYCKSWNSRRNLNKTKRTVFKKGGGLKAKER